MLCGMSVKFSTKDNCASIEELLNDCLKDYGCNNSGGGNSSSCKPTAAPKETEAPKPEEKPEPPKATEAPKPVETPDATEAPKPVETPETTEASKPVETPEVTEAPKPIETPKATEAPKPTATPKATQTPSSSESAYAYQVIELVNAERAKYGLSALSADTTLMNAAHKRAVETVTSFSHTRPNGTKFSTVLSEYGVSYRTAGENIAYGQRTPQDVVNSWMNSSGHRANILNSSYTKIGVGCYKSGSTYYWSQLFIG
ncbi:MAG: CAP domain-containing protein [Oscillospiraceae bacterium]|nr:CAP domain-containing protein [Oscillospiraceae bacterium]